MLSTIDSQPLTLTRALLVWWDVEQLESWGFPGIGVPPVIIHLNGIFSYKLSILGIPRFMETPKGHNSMGIKNGINTRSAESGMWATTNHGIYMAYDGTTSTVIVGTLAEVASGSVINVPIQF